MCIILLLCLHFFRLKLLPNSNIRRKKHNSVQSVQHTPYPMNARVFHWEKLSLAQSLLKHSNELKYIYKEQNRVKTSHLLLLRGKYRKTSTDLNAGEFHFIHILGLFLMFSLLWLMNLNSRRYLHQTNKKEKDWNAKFFAPPPFFYLQVHT